MMQIAEDRLREYTMAVANRWPHGGMRSLPEFNAGAPALCGVCTPEPRVITPEDVGDLRWQLNASRSEPYDCPAGELDLLQGALTEAERVAEGCRARNKDAEPGTSSGRPRFAKVPVG